MDYFPLFHDIRQARCLIVGGGSVATRKARQLHQAGAHLTVVAPEIDADMEALAAESPHHQLINRRWQSGDVAGKTLVIAATENREVNRQVSEAARQQLTPVNVVDDPELSSVIFPAIVDRSPLQIAFSTGGEAPVLARQLRTQLETLIPANYGRLTRFAGRLRERVKQRFDTLAQRRYFWESIFEGPVGEQVLAGNEQTAEQMFDEQLNATDNKPATGEVWLVGGGPGDPDLLTFKALRLMQKADVILYDRLVSEDVLALCRRDADYVYVGKARSNHTLPQEEINHRLVRLAKEGKRVLRLKGGDPFIFGRGGEEIDRLAEEGIPFQVVPGITAASGCASYAGIPLTHRDHAQSVRFVTGHLKDNSCDLPWTELVNPAQTVVFYMGLHALPEIIRQLLAHGRAGDTPIALIEKGGSRQQRVITGTFETIVEQCQQAGFKTPTLVIVGSVVTLHKSLKWYQGAE
ncbi:siroheme synthase CysG [Endozoicomonadaceae bacterium StTr2]